MFAKKFDATNANYINWHLCSSDHPIWAQVDKMYDIASSKYKQLSEIRKVNTQNLEVTEGEEKQAEWQPKSKRMMQLCLTDGVQDVTAIEYTPVKKITDTLLPGYKVMIIGPVVCRRGIILLEDNKYKEVGGEVESLLKPNALENVLARALGEPENPDPYNDNEPFKNMNPQNIQRATYSPNNNDNFFDDDFEDAVDLEAVTAIEQQSRETAVQERLESMPDRNQTVRKESNESIEETLLDIDFEPFENWPSDPSTSEVIPPQIENKKPVKEKMIIEEASTSTHKLPSSRNVFNQNASEFPDDDFDLIECDVIIETDDLSSRQDVNPVKNKIEMCPPLASMLKSTNRNVPRDVGNCISPKTTQKKKSTAKTPKVPQQMPKTMTIPNFFKSPSAPKICALRDVLCEPITEKTYKTVRGQVKNHSALKKRGKCWSVTALIADDTSSVEVCFDSKILEGFLGFTVNEFSLKKKLAKLDPEVNIDLRMRLRKAQHEIQNLDALLKLELVKDEMPKVVGISQLTAEQKNLMKTSA
ncbi:hypothetical protein PUN28_007975 [Cardiocondyla obscurior]|uniref:RecQ-mediated genome instability protein 1 n=1 Tax=Cardiocondyla obscurior TaxID=286306 RepID=A0AAW2G1Q5_9HYME